MGAAGLASGCERAASTLATNGTAGAREAALGWFTLIVASLVVAVIAVLVLVAAFRRRPPQPAGDGATPMPLGVPREAGENRWLTGLALVVPLIILTVAFAFTVFTINAVGAPTRSPAGTFDVIGHQWWWEVVYQDSANPARSFTTANEIHLPVGEPVRLRLQTADVIHSFWVPRLAGKMDLIPGQNNTMWLEARTPGTFSGPCGEYCGTQHSQMRVVVVAEPPEQYRAWLASQVRPATADSAHLDGRQVFMTAGCGSCHTIRGTAAGGGVGPDLTHIASRRTLGAGILPNTTGNLMGWIADAQAIKPGCDMPRMPVAPRAMEALVAYIETLH